MKNKVKEKLIEFEIYSLVSLLTIVFVLYLTPRPSKTFNILLIQISVAAYLVANLVALLRIIIELLAEIDEKLEKLTSNDHNTKMEVRKNEKE